MAGAVLSSETKKAAYRWVAEAIDDRLWVPDFDEMTDEVWVEIERIRDAMRAAGAIVASPPEATIEGEEKP